jgi:hypothetical protein
MHDLPWGRNVPSVFDEGESLLDKVLKLKCWVGAIQDTIDEADFIDRAELSEDQGRQDKIHNDYVVSELAKLKAYLLDEISRIEDGDLYTQDQTYGLSPRSVQTALESQYNFVRYYASTAKDYDDRVLTAKAFDDKMIEAKIFDLYSEMELM